MAETEERKAQDIGADEAYTVNLKETVAAEKDFKGRSRAYFDVGMQNLLTAQMMMMANYGTANAAINQQIVALVKQGLTTTGKQDENITGVNMTDVMEQSIANSPWAEFAKAVATSVVAQQNATAKKQ